MADRLRPRSASSRQTPKERAKQAAAEFEADNDPATIALFESLRAWRAKVAKERSRPAYTVFADTTLRSIAVVKPGTLPQLSLIHGVGAVKLQEYGADVLYVVREFQGGGAGADHPDDEGAAG